MITPGILAECTGATLARATSWVGPLEDAMAEFEINTPKRQAAFLAQIGHESGGLQWTKEIWGPTETQLRYEYRRDDLGNNEVGDGERFLGRGPIQITGRRNYARCGAALGLDLISDPDLLELAPAGSRAAGWFWRSHGLNELADMGDFARITLRVNGSLETLAPRMALWTKAKAALGVT